MNKIAGVFQESYAGSFWNSVNYRIDGYWLNEKLDALYPGNCYKGFTPALLYWIKEENEKMIVWERILPDEDQTSICPIYMDSEFLCFHGFLLVAEIKNCGQTIQWKRLGVNRSVSGKVQEAENIQWYDTPTDLTFSKEDYLNMLEVFKERLGIDKQRIEEFLARGNQEE